MNAVYPEMNEDDVELEWNSHLNLSSVLFEAHDLDAFWIGEGWNGRKYVFLVIVLLNAVTIIQRIVSLNWLLRIKYDLHFLLMKGFPVILDKP